MNGPGQDAAGSFEAVCLGVLRVCAAFLEQHGEASGDPVEVARLIADVVAAPTPAFRFPVGTAGVRTADAWIRDHVTRPWSDIEEEYLRRWTDRNGDG